MFLAVGRRIIIDTNWYTEIVFHLTVGTGTAGQAREAREADEALDGRGIHTRDPFAARQTEPTCEGNQFSRI